MADRKITKREILAAIKTVAQSGVEFEGVSTDDVIAFVDTTVAQLDAKAEKAKERAAKKKAVGDELREKVASLLTDEFQSIKAITAALEDEEITPAMVTARLTQLVKQDLAHKDKIDVDGRKVNGYAAGPAPEVETEE